ncbi:DUF4190 domain-containing protein [Cellulomonas xiejunii]|uniref:DUF4190 domain-containing protein n=1 Tax=Cellulomonas xiejunii TaxID=2968083 RepID=A0ABY5KPB3_9CELL|nr:DUF4190 domain-containing protein [Cellulomonas xiejunii]MCC2319848.1 DUF4190 domain-containing protein [Cellulomonas xiejunii]UUI70178.1 DUF4190 domain-containing protein [Cellulomonas xiejunii]
MSTPHEPQPGPAYGQEAAYVAHGGAAPVDATPKHAPAPGPQPVTPPDQDVQPGPPDGGYPVLPPPAYAPRNDLAVWSLVLGLLGVMGCVFFTGIPAVVVGNNARRAVAAGQANNDGMATAGIVLGWVATGLGVLVILVLAFMVLLPLLFLGLALPFLAVAP